MIEPLRKHDALLADVHSSREIEGDDCRLWWLGQSGFLIRWRGKHLLFDPYLSDSLTRKYAETDKPHVRMTELVIDPARLDFIDVVTSTHNHTDHLDGETLRPLLDANPDLALVCPEANRDFVSERLGTPREWPIGLDDGVSARVGDFELFGIAAAHEELVRDDEGRHHYLGYVARFGDWTVYHGGDTVLYDGMVERLKPFAPDLALLPINGRAPERRVAGNLDGPEAARLARDIGAKLVVPCHFEMFEFNTASPDAFVAECEAIGQRHRVMRCGERIDLTGNKP